MDVLPDVASVRQGEHAEKFYAIADAEVQVTVDGEARGVLRRGQGLREFALLRDHQRTSTVTAADRVTVYALAAEPFLAALEGHARRVAALTP